MKDIFKNAAQIIFTAMDDVKITVTYRVKTSSYNTSTGKVTISHTDYVITNCIRVYFTAKEIDGLAIKPEDFKLLIPVDDLPVTPKIDDYVLIDSKNHNIIHYEKDPADAVWTIQVRK